MRITMVELSPSGGLFQFSFQLGQHLAKAGHRVELVTGPRPELESDHPDFDVRGVLPTWHADDAAPGSRALRHLRRGWRALRHTSALGTVLLDLKRTRPDVVLWHPLRFSIDSWAVLVARRISRNTAFGIVLHEPRPLGEQRASTSFYRANPLLTHSLGAAVRRMDVIFVLGDEARDYVASTWRPRAILRLIPHGDERVFLPDTDVPPASEAGPRILFFGTWTRHKGIEVLLGAFRRVQERCASAELVVAGAVGGDVDFSAIAQRAQDPPGVTLLPGYMPMSEVPDLFASARVVALPYLRANQSGVAHLAQTFARPIVATAVGELSKVVEHGVAGFVVTPGDEAGLANALLALLEDPGLARTMGEAGRRRLASDASWERVADEVLAALQTAVRPGGPVAKG